MTTWRGSQPGPSERDPRPVSDSLDRVTAAMGAPKARLLAEVFAHWEQLVGSEIAAHAEPRSLRGGVLLLAVDQSAWATQLRYLAPDLLGHLRLATETTEITEIQIRVVPPTVASKPVPATRSRGR